VYVFIGLLESFICVCVALQSFMFGLESSCVFVNV